MCAGSTVSAAHERLDARGDGDNQGRGEAERLHVAGRDPSSVSGKAVILSVAFG